MTDWEWLRRRASAAVLKAILLASGAGSAMAQEAERAVGPLRYAGASNDAIYFVVGPQPAPPRPFTIWRWRFLKSPIGRFDSVAARTTVDCRANTQQVTSLEGFRDGRFLTSIPANAETGALITPPPGSAFAAVQQEACTPNTSASRRTAPDHRVARELADKLLGISRPAQAAAAPAAKPAPPAASGQPTPVLCKATGAVFAAAQEQSIRMGKMLLALGPNNSASGPELAKLRKTVADAEAKRDRALQVVRRHASAPTPDAAMVAQVRQTRMDEIEARLDQCAGSPATTAVQPKPSVPDATISAPPTPAKPAAAAAAPASGAKPGWTVATRSAPDLSDSYVEASQIDAAGRFALVYGCSVRSKTRYARVYTSEAFDDNAGYAPEVPLKLSIDNRPSGEFSFRFQKMPHFARVQGARGRSLETVDMTAWTDTKQLDRFVAAVRSATSSVAVSYFDKSIRFPAESAQASLGSVDAQCGGRSSAK